MDTHETFKREYLNEPVTSTNTQGGRGSRAESSDTGTARACSALSPSGEKCDLDEHPADQLHRARSVNFARGYIAWSGPDGPAQEASRGTLPPGEPRCTATLVPYGLRRPDVYAVQCDRAAHASPALGASDGRDVDDAHHAMLGPGDDVRWFDDAEGAGWLEPEPGVEWVQPDSDVVAELRAELETTRAELERVRRAPWFDAPSGDGPGAVEAAVMADLKHIGGKALDGRRAYAEGALRLARQLDRVRIDSDPSKTTAIVRELASTMDRVRGREVDGGSVDLRRFLAGLRTPVQQSAHEQPGDAGAGAGDGGGRAG